MVAPVILVEATPRRAIDGAPVTVRLAGGGAAVPYRYGGEHWRAGLSGLPKAIATLDFDGEQLGGGGVAQALELSWSPGSSAALAEIAGLFWTDAPIVVRIGPEGDAMPPVDTAGLVLEAAVENGALRIALSDEAADLKRAVLTSRFAGTGGIEGPTELAGQIKSRAFGRCFNVPGRLIDRANQIWCFGDPGFAWQAFDQVRDKGVVEPAAALTLLPWQGSIAATFAALQASAAIAGGGVLCPSIASLKWWTQPAGDLRADIRGEIGTGYVETAPEIAARIVAIRSTLAFAPGAVAAAVAARPGPCGWRIDSDTTTAADVISDLLGGVSLSWLIVDGAIEFRRWEWTASTRVARSHAVTRRRLIKPVATRKLGYRRNWSPMARGDLGAVVLATDVLYEDGTPVVAAIAAATDAAAAAMASVAALASDGIVSAGGEKQELIRLYQDAFFAVDAPIATSVALAARYGGEPTGAQRDTANAALTALQGYLNGLVPDWTDTAQQTPVDGQHLRELFAALYAATAVLTEANGAVARDKAAAAQADATSALAKVAMASSDGYLSPDEKRALVQQVAAFAAEKPVLDAQADARGVARATYDGAYAALVAYLATLSPAWDNAALDTAIAPATFNGKFGDYLWARVALDTALNAAAATTALWSGVGGDGKPSNNAGTNFELESVGTTAVTIQGNSVTAGGVAGTDSYTSTARSRNAYTGTAFAAGRLATQQTLLGLSDVAFDGGNMRYSWHWSSGGGHFAFEAGALAQDFGTSFNGVAFSAATLFATVYDGKQVIYTADGVACRVVSAPAGLTLRMGVTMGFSGASIAALQFGPFGDASYGRLIDGATGRLTSNAALTTSLLIGLKGTVSAVASATDQGGGSGVAIAIPNHVRLIATAAGQKSITYNAGSLVNRPYGSRRYVFVDDPALTGGAVVYQDTADPNVLVYSYRYHVTTIDTPEQGAAASTGSGGSGSSAPASTGVSSGSGGGGLGNPYYQIP